MMVHLQNACPADSAVVAAIRLVLATPLAVSAIPRLLHLLQIHCHLPMTIAAIPCVLPLWFVVGNLTWMLQDAPYIANDQHACHANKANKLRKASRSTIVITFI